MERRTKIITFSAGALLVLILAAAALAPVFRRNGQENINSNGEKPFLNTNAPRRNTLAGSANVAATSSPDIATKEPATQSVLFAIATVFAEKFGSFSTEGKFENLYDLKYSMTERMKQWTDGYVESNKNIGSSEFYGVTTRAIKPELISLSDDETQAQVLVSVQQEEFSGTAATRGKILYKRLLLDFVRDEGGWKVDAAVWQ